MVLPAGKGRGKGEKKGDASFRAKDALSQSLTGRTQGEDPPSPRTDGKKITFTLEKGEGGKKRAPNVWKKRKGCIAGELRDEKGGEGRKKGNISPFPQEGEGHVPPPPLHVLGRRKKREKVGILAKPEKRLLLEQKPKGKKKGESLFLRLRKSEPSYEGKKRTPCCPHRRKKESRSMSFPPEGKGGGAKSP